MLGCLAAGAHVLCEKPLATSVAEAEEMFAAAKRAGKTLMAAQNWRWNDNSRAIRRIVDTGDMGEIYYGEATALRRMGIPTWGMFHYKEHSHGGALLDVGVHMLDLAVWLMDNPKPVRVSAQMAAKFGKRPEIAKHDAQRLGSGEVRRRGLRRRARALRRTAPRCCCGRRGRRTSTPRRSHVRLLGTEAGATTTPPMVYRNHAGIPVDEKLQVPQRTGQLVHARDRALAEGRRAARSSRW